MDAEKVEQAGRRPIKGAVFGGFNRQDVLDVLQQMEQDYQRQLTECAQSGKEDLERTRGELEQARGELEELRGSLAQAEEKTAGLEEECAALRAEAEELRADAEAYRLLKVRAGEIEIDAQRRAALIVQEAEGRADELRQKLRDWLDQVIQDYDVMRSDADATISHTVAELNRLSGALTEQSSRLAESTQRAETVWTEFWKDGDG